MFHVGRDLIPIQKEVSKEVLEHNRKRCQSTINSNIS